MEAGPHPHATKMTKDGRGLGEVKEIVSLFRKDFYFLIGRFANLRADPFGICFTNFCFVNTRLLWAKTKPLLSVVIVHLEG